MLTDVKLALRRSDTAFDGEIQNLIDACLAELNGLGIRRVDMDSDPQVKTAVIAYCKWQFGENPDADRWERIYYGAVSKLQCRSGYGLDGD